MSALPWIAAGVGAAAVGALYLIRRSQPEAPSGPPPDTCDKLPEGKLRDACKAAKVALAIGQAVIPDTSDTVNVRLNGPAVERVPAAVADLRRVTYASGTQGAPVSVLKAPYTTKYQNGCVPVPGHPGWTRCAAGTQSMVSDQWFTATGYQQGFSPSSVLSGDRRRDPLTFQWPADRPWPGPAGSGTRFVYRGQYLVCGPGTTLATGTDHRDVQGPPCVSTATQPTQPPPTVPPRPPIVITTTGGTRDRRTD